MKHDINSEAISPEMIFHKCPGELRIYIDFGFLNLYRYERSHKPKDAVKSQTRDMLESLATWVTPPTQCTPTIKLYPSNAQKPDVDVLHPVRIHR